MEKEKEFLLVGRTFIMGVLMLVLTWFGTYLGFLLPETYETVMWAVAGVYGIKTVGHKAADAYKKKNGGGQ